MEMTASPLFIDQKIIPAPISTQPVQYVHQSATPALPRTTTTTTSTEHEVLPCNSATPPRETAEDTTSIERGSIPCSNTTQQIDSLTPTIEGDKGDTQDVMPPTPTMSEGQPEVQKGGGGSNQQHHPIIPTGPVN